MALSAAAILTASQPRAISVTVYSWPLWVPGLRTVAQQYRRIGQEGSGRQHSGRRSPIVDVRTWSAYTTRAAAVAACEDLDDMVGERIAVVTADNLTYQADVVDVRGMNGPLAPKAMRGPPVSGTTQAAYLLEFVISLERQPE